MAGEVAAYHFLQQRQGWGSILTEKVDFSLAHPTARKSGRTYLLDLSTDVYGFWTAAYFVTRRFRVTGAQETRLKIAEHRFSATGKAKFRKGRHAGRFMDSRKTRPFIDRALCIVDGSLPG